MDEVVFKDIEFIPVRDDSLLVIFVAKSGLVQQRVLQVDFPLDREELRRMSAYLKTLLDGKTLSEVQQTILHELRDERAQADQIMRRALQIGERSLQVQRDPAEAVLVEGERTFFDQPEFSDIVRMRQLLRAFEEKTVLLRLLSAAASNPVDAQLAQRPDTKVVFGAEASMRETKDLAVVFASYGVESGPRGQVGVVGPMRMDYARVIPLVEYTAGSLSASFASEDQPAEGADSPTPPEKNG